MATDVENKNFSRNGPLLDILAKLVEGLKIIDETGDIAQVDSSIKGLVTIDTFHRKIHLGELFFVSRRVKASSAIRYYLFRTGSKELHIKFNAITGLGTEADILKNVTVTGIGTAMAIQNYNDNSIKTVETLVYEGAITFTGGTVYRENQSGFGSTPGQAVSGSTSTDIEYNFKPNADYILRLTPEASTTTRIIADFYEEAPHA